MLLPLPKLLNSATQKVHSICIFGSSLRFYILPINVQYSSHKNCWIVHLFSLIKYSTHFTVGTFIIQITKYYILFVEFTHAHEAKHLLKILF